MYLIGEKLNSSIPSALAKMSPYSEKKILSSISEQFSSGADCIDINCALCGNTELETLLKIARLVFENTSAAVMLDSPSESTLISAARELKKSFPDRTIILNSATLTERLPVIPTVKELGLGLVFLPMNDNIPVLASEKLEFAGKSIDILDKSGIAHESIFVDILTQTVASDDQSAKETLDFIRLFKKDFPDIKTISGLSNISYGLPCRAEINSAFMVAAASSGLDAAICDVTKTDIVDAAHLGELFAGKDEFCMGFIERFGERA